MMPFLRVAFGFALALFCGGAFAQDVNLIAANGPIALDRGQLTPKSDEAIYLNDTDGCDFLVETNGWEREGCAFVDRVMFLTTNDVDTLIVGVPDDSGYVDFADWNEPDRDDAISSIWAELQTSIADQISRRTHRPNRAKILRLRGLGFGFALGFALVFLRACVAAGFFFCGAAFFLG